MLGCTLFGAAISRMGYAIRFWWSLDSMDDSTEGVLAVFGTVVGAVLLAGPGCCFLFLFYRQCINPLPRDPDRGGSVW